MLQGMILFFSIMFQPAGKVAMAFILSISRQGVISSIVLVVVEFAAGYMGIVWAQAVSDMITALVVLILLFRLVLYNDTRRC